MSVNKYQFYISFNNKVNTAASKAIQDCRSILASHGYKDYTIDDIILPNRFYLLKILYRTIKFFLVLKPNSVVAIQYPLLSGNNLFKYFIKLSKIKGVNFFCIVHDIDDLRYKEAFGIRDSKDVKALNYYDCVIVHNTVMKKWLIDNNATTSIITLQIFDYLTVKNTFQQSKVITVTGLRKAVFAGNLSKSKFIYSLNLINDWFFNLYGPNYQPEEANTINNICWNGSLGPDEILTVMNGAFGLIWDGDYVDRLDEINGNYLKFNNPHKLSLYVAAGLPVIAPRESAIGIFIKEHNIGILVNDLTELANIHITEDDYKALKRNVLQVSNKVKSGEYLSSAITEAEECIQTHNYQKNIVYN